jgi:predicted enzyme related to lactoylglutathione lyase
MFYFIIDKINPNYLSLKGERAMPRVIHFELPSTNLAASRKFYENVFGWTLTKWEGPTEYWLVSTGEADKPGINGALGGAANDMKGTVNTVDVDDLDEAIRKAETNGGQVIMPKNEIPGVGWLAYVREPGGAVLGMIQSIPGAMM